MKTKSFLSLLALLLALAPLPSARAAYNWGPSGLVGSGTQNCVAIQPGGSVVISAADVSGFQRSPDDAASWFTSNVGTPTSGPQKVATVRFSNNPSTPNTVYGGTGDVGSGGGFLVSTDAGQTWSLKAGSPSFSGNGETSVSGLPSRWPRSTGNLIACDETGATKYIYVGSFQDGVFRSTDGGTTWTLMGLAGTYIRSIAIDPNAPWSIFVAIRDDNDTANDHRGVWHCNTARTTTNTGTGRTGWSHQTSAPNTPEELSFVGSHLYAVGKSGTTGGAWKTTDSGTTWTRIGATSIDTSPTWLAVAGYVNGANDVLFIGATDAVQQSGDTNFRTILRSMDSGANWSPVTLALNIVNQIGGPGGPPWWEGLPSGNSGYLLGHTLCDVCYLTVDPSHSNRVLVGGRAGVWGSTNANNTDPTTIRWYPMVNGLSVCVAECVTIDQRVPGRAYVGDEDHVFFWTADYGTSYEARNPKQIGNTSRCIFVDPLNSTVYVGTNDDAGTTGGLYSNPDPTNASNSWSDTGLGGVTSNGRVWGGVAGRDGSSNAVLIAAVNSLGLYRKVGSGGWSNVSSTIVPQAATTMKFAWRNGSPYVFVYRLGTDANAGVWRSNNYGASGSWSLIWAKTSSAKGSGFIVSETTTDNTVYVSVDTGVFRLDNATGTPVATAMGGPANPGPLAQDSDGSLYVCDIVSSAHPARLYKWNFPATSTTSAVISDSTIYPGQSGWPDGLAVDNSGIVHVSERDNGVMNGATDTLLADDFEDGNATGWTVDSGTWSVVTDGTAMYKQSAAGGGTVHRGTSTWSDYAVQADIKLLAIGAGSAGISLRFTDTANRYFVLLNSDGNFYIKKNVAGTQTVLASVPFTVVNGTTYHVRFAATGSRLTAQVYVNGVLQVSARATDTTFATGAVALNCFNATTEYDNVVVTSSN